jgi:archaellum biogenesis ATPase FlaH/CheY-like chemotaxis protein
MVKKILVVNGDRLMLGTLVEAFTSEGYETCQAEDGLEAIRVMAETSPDLIVTDVHIRGLNGYLLTRYIRRESDIPVVIMTEVLQEADVLRNTDVGADLIMTKPVDVPQLIDNVARLLSVRSPGMAYDPSHQKLIADLDDGSSLGPAAAPMRIDLGDWEFDEVLNGGIPSASMTLVEGPEDSGKSVLCQNLAYSAYRWGLRVAYYTSLPSADELSDQMSSLGRTVDLDGPVKFKITSLANLFARQLDPSTTLTVLWQHMKRMYREGIDVVIFDDLPLVASGDYGPLINFFQRSVELSRQGITILSIIRSSGSDRKLVDQLHEIVDAHLSLTVEEVPKADQMETFNQMVVRKIDGGTPFLLKGVVFRVSARLIKIENRSLEALPMESLVV